MAKPNNKQNEKTESKIHREFTADDLEIHRRMVAFMFGATAILVVVFAVLLYSSYKGWLNPFHLSALMVVAVAGALGGFVSALRRLYAFAPIFPSATFSFWREKSTGYIIMYSAIPPLVGAIAAVVVYLVFAARMIEGPLFPHFDFDPTPGVPRTHTFENFVANWQPKLTTDYAKAFVWAFIAGFSEKFVPDILNGLAKSSQKSEKDASSE